MRARLNPLTAAPKAMRRWFDFGKAILESALDEGLVKLVKICASQIDRWDRLALDIRAIHPVGERKAV